MTESTAVIEQTEAQVPEVKELTPMTLLAQVVENPDFAVEKLDQLMTLQERWEDRQAQKAFNDAMAAFQAEIPAIKKNAEGAHNIMYATLDQIMRTIQPYLSKHGLAVRFSTRFGEGGAYIEATCVVSHKDGHSETSEITVPVDAKMTANSSQKMGSANSYAKRYALGNALNLAFTELDDDAANLYETLTDDQVTVLNDLLEETGSDKNAFLKWAGVAEVELIAAKHFTHCQRTLERKREGS